MAFSKPVFEFLPGQAFTTGTGLVDVRVDVLVEGAPRMLLNYEAMSSVQGSGQVEAIRGRLAGMASPVRG